MQLQQWGSPNCQLHRKVLLWGDVQLKQCWRRSPLIQSHCKIKISWSVSHDASCLQCHRKHTWHRPTEPLWKQRPSASSEEHRQAPFPFLQCSFLGKKTIIFSLASVQLHLYLSAFQFPSVCNIAYFPSSVSVDNFCKHPVKWKRWICAYTNYSKKIYTVPFICILLTPYVPLSFTVCLVYRVYV